VGTNGIITTIAGNGNQGYSGDGVAATNTSLFSPIGVALDPLGDLFIADQQNNRIREVMNFSSQSLTLTNVTKENSGYYQVIISGASGSVTSSVVSLGIITTPIITSQPTSQVQAVSNNVYLGVSAIGPASLNYQWYFVNTNLQRIAGAYSEMLYGFVYGANVTNGGSGYITAPQVQFLGGGGTGAAGYAVVSNGIVTEIVMTNAGYCDDQCWFWLYQFAGHHY
jgi:hypothetical protein